MNTSLIITISSFTLTIVILIIKYVSDYQKHKDKLKALCETHEKDLEDLEDKLNTKINHNHELFDIHRKDNEKEHTALVDSNNKILALLTELKTDITKLFERMPKRREDEA